MTAIGHHNPLGQATREHPGLAKLGRAGWLAKGIVYVIAGVLCLMVASKASGWSKSSTTGAQEASPTGALKTVAHATAGPLLMWVLAIGLLIYAAWRLVSAALPGDADAEAVAKRIGFVVSAIIYATFAFTAIALATSSATPANTNGNSKVTSLTGRVMGHSAGRWLIGLVGLIVVAVGVYRISKGVKQDINDELDLSGLSSERLRWTERLGRIGEIGRGTGIGLVGFFLLRAAMTYDPNEATGLDGALRRLAVNSWGVVVIVVVGVGFAAYGVFCASTFTRRRLEAPCSWPARHHGLGHKNPC
ncbi:MAG: hypothetical protein JWN99_1398 [Ilumatobacteraceae bacterium]|nr:hypothetical protein [Ilumatobacteraceae bacterium]